MIIDESQPFQTRNSRNLQSLENDCGLVESNNHSQSERFHERERRQQDEVQGIAMTLPI